ncbi:response regulator [Segnochrobactrum spirostomi]|uniref:response regulator n=1 Tax=Segnochrobactrum spirostomi TaxID=2608987 RepID=UPI0012952DC9|nr:response regulator [Segnochrobactrum spirostomi]
MPDVMHRVLIAEDEDLIALVLGEMLSDLGHRVVAVAERVEEGVELARDADIDLAILDINLDGGLSMPIADVLTARGIPYIFATGGTVRLEAPYASHFVLRKPFTQAALRAALETTP